MVISVASLVGRVLVQRGMNQLIAQVTAQAVEEVIESFREESAELASQRIGVIDIESDTWYAFHMANRQSWEAGLRKWADVLKREIPRRYVGQGAGPGSRSMFRTDINATGEGLDIRLVRLPGSPRGISRAAAQGVIRKAVQDTIKAYIRCVATGGAGFPEDYEGA